MAYFYFILYIPTVSLNGCFWKMPCPVSPYVYARLSIPVSVLFRISLPTSKKKNCTASFFLGSMASGDNVRMLLSRLEKQIAYNRNFSFINSNIWINKVTKIIVIRSDNCELFTWCQNSKATIICCLWYLVQGLKLYQTSMDFLLLLLMSFSNKCKV